MWEVSWHAQFDSHYVTISLSTHPCSLKHIKKTLTEKFHSPEDPKFPVPLWNGTCLEQKNFPSIALRHRQVSVDYDKNPIVLPSNPVQFFFPQGLATVCDIRGE